MNQKKVQQSDWKKIHDDKAVKHVQQSLLFYCVIRIKTIYLEIVERQGLPFRNDFQVAGESVNVRSPDFHSKYYYELFAQDAEKRVKVLNEVRAQFELDLKCNKFKKASLEDKSISFKSELNWILDDNEFVLAVVKANLVEYFDFQEEETVHWKDIRMSRAYFKHLCKFHLWFDFTKHLRDLMLGNTSTDFNASRQPRMIAFQALLPIFISKTVRQGRPYYALCGFLKVQPRRVPVLTKNRQVVAFAHYQYLEWVSHQASRVHRTDQFAHTQILKWFVNEYRQKHHENPNTFLCFEPKVAFRHLPQNERSSAAFNFSRIVKILDVNKNQGCDTYTYKVSPIEFKDMPVLPKIQDKFIAHPKLREYYCPEEFQLLEQSDKYRTANEQIIQQVSEDQGGLQLLKLIKSVPNLKFKLTPEQELMISTPQNILCLGRSGTGKTTTSALRLFATEAYYKYHNLFQKFKLDNPNASTSQFKPAHDFILSNSDVKLLFVSASPVLVNEVKRFFIEFKTHFTQELLRVRSGGIKKEEEKDDFQKFLQTEIAELEQEEAIEKQASLVTSMEYLSAEDFPLFLTVKRLLYMLDASTDFPFFSRNAQGEQIGMDTNVQWHNESSGVFMINQYQKGDTDLDLQIKQLGTRLIDFTERIEAGGKEDEDVQTVPKVNPNDYRIGLGEFANLQGFQYNANFASKGQNLSFEVDFEVFRTRFWPKVAASNKFQPLVAWTEICSEIKGRQDSWKYDLGGIPDHMYIRANRAKNHFLQPEERFKIYEIFLHYEKWKASQYSYDLNDLVNHILRQIKVNLFKANQQVHFLMVDEVQDLTQNVISLFMMLAEKNVFFSGDTAQTIAKGVGFRFFDLKQVFTKQNYESDQQFEVPKVLQLAKNFRSHSKILDLANSIVSLLELLFPRTIDKLIKEKSDNDGPKPILFDQIADPQKLLEKYLIFGSENKSKSQFGCTQVIIVRDQESKEQVPDFLKEMLCLTVYEAKGLEFDDVILFNFFQDSKCASQWKLLQDVVVQQTRVKTSTKVDFTDFDLLECLEQIETEEDVQTQSIEGDTEVSTKLTLRAHHDLVYRKFAQVCSELKLLYVACTRPKNFLLIYDQDTTIRKPIQEYWLKTQSVDYVDKKFAQNPELLPPDLKATLRISNTPDLVKGGKHLSDVLKQTWQLQGLKLFKVRFYKAAAQCFQNIGDTKLVLRCQAYEAADLASTLRGQHDSKLSQSNDKKTHKSDRRPFKQEAKLLLKESNKQMLKAGQLFAEIEMFSHAAQCYYSAGSLQDSAELFEKQGQFGPAAECCYKLRQFKKAASLYADAQLFSNAFQCFEEMEDWDGLVMCLHRHKAAFGKNEREVLIEKYFPVALQQVYQQFCGEGDLNEENRGKVQQMRLKLKFQRSVSVIQEEEQDYSGESSEAEVEEIKQPTRGEQVIQIDTTYPVDEQDSSTVIVNDLSSAVIPDAATKALELELLSNIDPEDEFLAKSYSVIESVSNSSYSVLQSEYSDYSIISGSALHSAVSSSFEQLVPADSSLELSDVQSYQSQAITVGKWSVIKPSQNDDFTDDIMLQKIVYYISLFRQEVRDHLQSEADPFSGIITDDQADFMMIELDELPLSVIEMVIETLEHYEMYRLCIMVYTRFKLSAKIGKFVSAICQKYSNLSQYRIESLEKFKTASQIEVQAKYSIVANTAVQNVLQLIGQQSGIQQTQQWIQASFDQFLMQGYWRKLVYMLECDRGCELAWAMGDSESLKILYLVQKCGISDKLQQIVKDLPRLKQLVKCQVDNLITQLVKYTLYQESPNKNYIIKPVQGQSLWQQLCTKPHFSILKSTWHVFRNIAQSKVPATDEIRHAFTYAWQAYRGRNKPIRRMMYRAYHVSLLDDLQVFKTYENQYCIIKKTSPLWAGIQKLQDVSLQLARCKWIEAVRKEHSLKSVNAMSPEQIAQKASEFTKSKAQLSVQMAIVCDLNLESYLVPKRWVKDLIDLQIVKVALKDLKHKEDSLELQYIVQQYVKRMMPTNTIYMQILTELKGHQTQCHHPYFLAFTQILDSTGMPELSKQEIIEQLQLRSTNIVAKITHKQPPLSIQKAPCIAAVPKSMHHSTEIDKLVSEFFKYTKPNKLADQQYALFHKFVDLEQVPLLEELLLQNKLQQNLKLLVKCHQKEQSNNLTEASSALLDYLQQCYTTLNFQTFCDIVVKAFAYSWFSFQIYNSKTTVLLTKEMHSCLPGVQSKLQDVRVMPATIKAVKKALTWIECFLMNLSQYEGYTQFQHLFVLGFEVVQIILKSELDFTQLQAIFTKLQQVAKAAMTRYRQNQFQELADFTLTLTPACASRVHKICSKIIEGASLSQYVTVELANRKQVNDRINQITIDCTNAFQDSQNKQQFELARRQKAAQFIKSNLKRYRNRASYFVQDLIDFETIPQSLLQINQNLQPQFNKDIHSLYSAQSKIIQFLASNIPHTTQDSQHATSLLQQLQLQEVKLIHSGDHDFEVEGEFDQWLESLAERKDQTLQTQELERKRFIKREKWGTVIQFHKRKRVMLRHLGANKQKKK